EAKIYEYNPVPITFTLDIKNVSLNNLGDLQAVFVKFENDKVLLYTSGLDLSQILEKAKIAFDTQCLTLEQKQYCGEKIKMAVNGENSTIYGNYVPKEGDVVEIEYS
ncbi:MAG: hypothetical protein AABX05_01470, partial [Nanoarchaeota archaeon]